MWLINVKTRALEEYFGSNIPPYAILSHTWEEEEVSFKQYVSGNYMHLEGYNKIDMTCRIAEGDNLNYAWVDTCCIDKSSSAELSEAINSMFRWYQRADVCYVYLSDLLPDAVWSRDLEKCRWFTRGWTLQELIAPTKVIFYDSCWQWNQAKVGSPRSKSTRDYLVVDICQITKIDRRLLNGERLLHSYSVAQKFSWASRRRTTRIEDVAYCLLGIFDLNMPLLYGEEEKAFRRLQEEIIRSTADLSILAWSAHRLTAPENYELGPILSSMLANSPVEFEDCGMFEPLTSSQTREFSITNIGIKICTMLSCSSINYAVSILPLDCSMLGFRLGLRLRHIGPDRYLRRNPEMIDFCEPEVCKRELSGDIYLLTRLPPPFSNERFAPAGKIMERMPKHTLRIATNKELLDVWPPDLFDEENNAFYVTEKSERDLGVFRIRWDLENEDTPAWVQSTIVALGWAASSSGKPQFTIFDDEALDNALQTIQKNVNALEYGRSAEYIVNAFVSCGIRRSHHLVREIHDSDMVALLTIEPDMSPSDIYCSEIWIYGSLVRKEDVPEFEGLVWDVPTFEPSM